MKALIVDNQKEIRAGLKLLLQKYCPVIKEISEADGVVSGLQAIYDWKPDLVFTDVEMDDGTGMDMLSQVKDPSFQIIFITAFNKYAVDAFRYSAIDFLLKPIDPELLIESVQRASENLRKQSMAEQLAVLKAQFGASITERRIVLKDQKAIHIAKVADLIFLRADGVYTEFTLVGGEKILMSKNIKEYEELLGETEFIRVHNSFLVNTSHIQKMDRSDGGTLIMTDKHEVPVSSRKKEVVLDYLRKL